MTMLEPSQPHDLPQMELPLMQYAGGSRAKILVLQAQALGLKENAAAYGSSTTDLLASFDLNSLSWKTSQGCLAGGDQTFLDRLPRSGMMRSGKLYRRPQLALPICVSECGSWPTPAARDGKDLSKLGAFSASAARKSPSMATRLLLLGASWVAVSASYEMSMGFPLGWSAAVYTPAGTP